MADCCLAVACSRRATTSRRPRSTSPTPGRWRSTAAARPASRPSRSSRTATRRRSSTQAQSKGHHQGTAKDGDLEGTWTAKRDASKRERGAGAQRFADGVEDASPLPRPGYGRVWAERRRLRRPDLPVRRPCRGHLLFVKILLGDRRLWRSANGQNPSDFFNRSAKEF
jgi:hypothetical protein